MDDKVWYVHVCRVNVVKVILQETRICGENGRHEESDDCVDYLHGLLVDECNGMGDSSEGRWVVVFPHKIELAPSAADVEEEKNSSPIE